MKALVGTYRNLMLLEEGIPAILREGSHYGITWDHKHIYVSYNPPHEDITRIEVYDSNLNYLGMLPIHTLQSVHQIHWYDGTLYITNTEYNRIEMWDGAHVSTWDYTDLLTIEDRSLLLLDLLHINSIWTDGMRWYICEHGYKYPPARIRIFDMDFNQVQLIELEEETPPNYNVHNVYLEDGHMYVCKHRHVAIRNYAGQLMRRIFPHGDDLSPFILRGLARTADYFYIGESTEAPRELRSEGDSEILILDGELCLLDSILLKDTGQIYEIRIMDEKDCAHNGILCPAI